MSPNGNEGTGFGPWQLVPYGFIVMVFGIYLAAVLGAVGVSIIWALPVMTFFYLGMMMFMSGLAWGVVAFRQDCRRQRQAEREE